MTKLIVLLVMLFAVMVYLPSVHASRSQARDAFTSQPARPAGERDVETGTLSYNELIELYQQDVPSESLRNKLNRLLTTPFVSNKATSCGVRPLKASSPQIGKFFARGGMEY